MTSKQLSKSLNQGLRWYGRNLKTPPLDYATDIDKLLNAVNPLTLNEIQELCDLDPKQCPRYTLNQLKKADLLKMLETGPCPDNRVVASKIPHTPSVTKSQLVESLLNHPMSQTKPKQTGGNFRTGNKRTGNKRTGNKPTGTQSRRYDDLGAKTLALLKLEKYAKLFHLIPNKKLPLTNQKAIKKCVSHLKSIYQTGGATVPVPAADPIIIATAIGGVLLLTIIAIGMFKWFKPPSNPEPESTPLLETPSAPVVEPTSIGSIGGTIEPLLNRANNGDYTALLALSKMSLSDPNIRARIINDNRFQSAKQKSLELFNKFLPMSDIIRQSSPYDKALEKVLKIKETHQQFAKSLGSSRLPDGSIMRRDGTIQ